MKNIHLALLLAAVAAFYGCTPLSRVNPTDPQSGGSYTGMHYLGEIGDFIKLEEFNVMGDTIWCVDSVTNNVYKYSINGDLAFSFTGGGITAPTGICSDNSFFYVADKDTYRNIKRFDPAYVSNTAQVQLQLPSPTYDFIKCAASPSYLYAATSTTVYTFDTAANLLIGVPCGGFTNISDIKYNPGTGTGEVAVADSGTNIVYIFNTSLSGPPRQITFIENIIGFGIKDNYIYVPTVTGIHQYYYDTGVTVKTFANFGEGAGRITAPGACGIYGNYVLVGTGTTIKYFGP